MSSNNLELRIVKITEDLGKGVYLSEDVFSQEKITVILSGKLRMTYIKLIIESEVYVEINSLNRENIRGRYILTFRDAMNDDNTIKTHLDNLCEQKVVLDAKYIKRFGANKFVHHLTATF